MNYLRTSLSRIAALVAGLLIPAAVMTDTTVSAKDNGPDELKVMSYNIRLSTGNDGSNSWNYRYYTSAMMISDVKPDIIGLQEAMIDQMTYLKEYTKGYKWVGKGRDDGKKKGEIMGILYNKSRVSLSKWGTFWLSETPDTPSKGWDAACFRTATWAIMKDKRSGKKFVFINTHLDHKGPVAREKGLEMIVAKAKEFADEGLPVVVTGDFNTVDGDMLLDGINAVLNNARDYAMDSDKGDTFNGWGKGHGAIDYIFYTGFSSCQEFVVHRKPYDNRKFISDHYPIYSTLIF